MRPWRLWSVAELSSNTWDVLKMYDMLQDSKHSWKFFFFCSESTSPPDKWEHINSNVLVSCTNPGADCTVETLFCVYFLLSDNHTRLNIQYKLFIELFILMNLFHVPNFGGMIQWKHMSFDLGILSRFPRSFISHVRESGGILILSTSYLMLWLLGGGSTVSTFREEVWNLSFLPSQRSERALALKRCTALFEEVWLRFSGGCRPLSCQTGWVTGVKWNYLTSSVHSKTSQETNPFLWLPLPNLSAHIHAFIQHLQSILQRDFCLLGNFKLLYHKHCYAGRVFLLCSSGCLIISVASAPSYIFIVRTRTMHSSVLPFHTQLRCWQPVYYRLDILQSLSVITQLRNMR